MLALRDNGEPGSLGYPVHLRRIALANGRMDGQSGQGGTPCGKMFDMVVKLRATYTGLAIGGWLLFSPLSQPPSARVASCTARYAPAANTSCLVFDGVLNYGVYGLLPSPLNYYYQSTFGVNSVDAGSQGSWDLAPGGSRDTQASLKRQAEAGGRDSTGAKKPYEIDVTNVSPNHCFIPTVSALGFQYQSMASYQNTGSLPNPYTNLLAGNLICGSETPFDAFYAPPSVNTGHVTVADANASAFLIGELTPRTPTPAFISEPKAICPNSVVSTFTVKHPCTQFDANGQARFPTVYNWTLAGPAVFTATGTQTLTASGNSQDVVSTATSGTVTLTVLAQRAGAAPSTPLTRTLPISGGEILVTNDPDYSRPTAAKAPPASPSFSCSEEVHLLIANLNAPPPYTATITTYRPFGPGTKTYGGFGSVFQWTVNDFDIDIVISAPSACDGAIVQSEPYRVAGCLNRAAKAAPAAYPNPADAVLHLAAPEASDAAGPRTAVLYSAQGREVRHSRPGEAQLPTADLPTGLYYLVVEQDGRLTRSQIRVQH